MNENNAVLYDKDLKKIGEMKIDDIYGDIDLPEETFYVQHFLNGSSGDEDTWVIDVYAGPEPLGRLPDETWIWEDGIEEPPYNKQEIDSETRLELSEKAKNELSGGYLARNI